MKKMIVLGTLFVLLTLSGSLNGKSDDQKWIKYTNQEYGYSLSYPLGWTIKEDQTQNGYVSLFDNRAFMTKDQSLELLAGIKIEIISNMEDQDYLTVLEGTIISIERIEHKESKNIEEIKTYSYEDENTIILIVPVFKKTKTVFIAYIPEKDKKTAYTKQFNEIILTFKQF